MVVNEDVEGGVGPYLGGCAVVELEGLLNPLDQPGVGHLQPGGEDRD